MSTNKNILKKLFVISLALFFFSAGYQPFVSNAQDALDDAMDAMDAEDEKREKAKAQRNSGVNFTTNRNAPQQRMALKGPKRTLSIGKFTSMGAFTAKYDN